MTAAARHRRHPIVNPSRPPLPTVPRSPQVNEAVAAALSTVDGEGETPVVKEAAGCEVSTLEDGVAEVCRLRALGREALQHLRGAAATTAAGEPPVDQENDPAQAQAQTQAQPKASSATKAKAKTPLGDANPTANTTTATTTVAAAMPDAAAAPDTAAPVAPAAAAPAAAPAPAPAPAPAAAAPVKKGEVLEFSFGGDSLAPPPGGGGGGKGGPSLQDRFARFRKERQRERKLAQFTNKAVPPEKRDQAWR